MRVLSFMDYTEGMAKKRRIAQTPKTADRLPKRIRAEVERAGSNAAGPHGSKAYSRTVKHINRNEW